MKRLLVVLVFVLAACLPPVEPTADMNMWTPTQEVGYGQN